MLAAILLASTALAMVATAIQLWLDYTRDVDAMEEQFTLIERTFADSIANSLWSLDKQQIQLQLDGLLRLREVQFARVRGHLGERFAAGPEAASGVVTRDVMLRSPTGGHEAIGTLTVGLGLGGIYQRLFERGLVIFLTQAAKTALIALFILFIVRRWVTRHLERMAAHARALTVAGLARPLELQRSAGAPPDELDEVASALNEMSASLGKELDARNAAESELRLHRDQLEDIVRQRTSELRAAKDHAEAANRSKSEFLSRMSHELRTPLNAILGYAQLLRADPETTPRIAAGLDVIRSSGQHQLALIVDVLDLARIEAGRIELAPAPVELRPFLERTLEMLRVKADEKRLPLTLEVDPDLPAQVLADEQRLRQVLLNLIGNAIKFTDAGCVALQVRRAATPGLVLAFEVRDSGVGIAPADTARIFEAFEQAGDPKRRHAGTGLGLAISRQLVRQMGSDITVESCPGAGSVFRFEAGAKA